MNTREINQKVQFSASPEQVYNAIMSSALHSEFTQSESVIGEKPGDSYSAYDGYIQGHIMELVPHKRIMKTWIAHEEGWPEDHVSEVKFEFFPNDRGTEMHFTHYGVPAEKFENFRDGWKEHYWEPMQEMFEKKMASQAQG
jgi:activator of HSP90 ATPase